MSYDDSADLIRGSSNNRLFLNFRKLEERIKGKRQLLFIFEPVNVLPFVKLFLLLFRCCWQRITSLAAG